MKTKAILKGLAIGVCVLALAGCGVRQTKGQEKKEMPVTEQYQNNISGTEDMPLDEGEKDTVVPETDDADSNGNTGQPLLDGDTDGVPNGAGPSAESQNRTANNDTGGKVDANSLYVSAALTGSVVDFSDDGCTVSAAITEDDGKTGVIAAPGCESEGTNVAVAYQEGCVVQIATIYNSTGIAELEQASVADIKKQASIIIYGNFEDTDHISADRIIICHRTA